jgi:hypothetical protein
MNSRILYIRSIALLALSALIVVSLCIQFTYGLELAMSSAGSYIEQFFSFFTVLSTIFVATVFFLEGKRTLRGGNMSSSFESVRGAAIFCILTTGIIYNFFPKGPGGHGGQVVDSIHVLNTLFHYIVPTIAVLDWIAFPPKNRITWSTLFSWFGLTIIYLILVELGGLLSKTYPYFFLDPTMFRGYSGVLFASASFLPFFLVFAVLVIGSANFQRRFRGYK